MSNSIGKNISNFAAALDSSGSSFKEYVDNTYISKWSSNTAVHAMAIRTTFVNSMHNYLTDSGLFNLERVSLSPVTDPLAHDIEHSPAISYKGQEYKTTHSMIYSKFLACFNPNVKGIFVDSPNIRLELAEPNGNQRGKYLIDFSQMDIELRRKEYYTLEQYTNEVDKVLSTIKCDMENALEFFEGMIVKAVTDIKAKNQKDLDALNVDMVIPATPFPRITKDAAIEKTGTKNFEEPISKILGTQFFWVTGLMRENYDLIYPYVNADGTRKAIEDFTSENIFNYDLCAQSLQADGSFGKCFEVMSGALREWLYEPIVDRLIDNKIIKVRPEFSAEGSLLNAEDLEGYGPFLQVAYAKDKNGDAMFPSTFGGGLGIERFLFSVLNGSVVKKVDDVTLFGKNPDSHPLYLF